jgi:transcriptional regulator with XRE-family HTH domain
VNKLLAVMDERKLTQKQGTLGWLEELSFTHGAEGISEARRAFEKRYPSAGETYYSLNRAGEGRPVCRTDAEAKDGISYSTYSPPSLWGASYQILRLRLEKVEQDEFIYHAGEELLTPIAGSVRYHFCWWNPKSMKNGPEVEEIKPVKPGSIIRVNPELAHHAWADNKEGAEAWMITRHLSNTGTSIYLNTEIDAPDVHPTPRRVKRTELMEPGRYALISWGIAEKIRLQRERSHLRTSQVAPHCSIDSSHLSRIENADTNASLDTLLRICRFLNIDLHAMIAPPPWAYSTDRLLVSQGGNYDPALPSPPSRPGLPEPSHFLHPICWELSEGETASKKALEEMQGPHPSSWVVLKGQVVMEIEAGAKMVSELATKDSVVHLRKDHLRGIKALQESKLLQIIYSGQCLCRPGN